MTMRPRPHSPASKAFFQPCIGLGSPYGTTISVMDARKKDRILRSVPLDDIPVLKMDVVSLTRQDFDAREGFVLSRVNGEWDVRSILKLCPMSEEDALLIFARLLERKVIELRK